ncbi:hypothetical protein AACH06_29920 [Ideonella sp. DXS29W]|uniref:Uncharacterized protein n=1 Tax=Ideonella lacteola TaxID=2984193 RepID=A0ABU9C1X4_9BURK
MMFFAILILPMGTDVTDEKSVEQAASELMRPFEMWKDEIPVESGHWDYYWCCSKEWMDESQISYSAYTGIPVDQPLVVFPVEQLSVEGVTDSIVTPRGEWIRSKSTYVEEDPPWDAKALGVCRSFPGHFGVLAYCHG